jgi:hypothetical protein
MLAFDKPLLLIAAIVQIVARIFFALYVSALVGWARGEPRSSAPGHAIKPSVNEEIDTEFFEFKTAQVI